MLCQLSYASSRVRSGVQRENRHFRSGLTKRKQGKNPLEKYSIDRAEIQWLGGRFGKEKTLFRK
jgi:hypothetical protein